MITAGVGFDDACIDRKALAPASKIRRRTARDHWRGLRGLRILLRDGQS
jgi:hypothetical protein